VPQSHVEQSLHLFAARRVQRRALQERAELGQRGDGGLRAGVDDRDPEIRLRRGGFLEGRRGLVDVEGDAERRSGASGWRVGDGGIVGGNQGQSAVYIIWLSR